MTGIIYKTTNLVNGNIYIGKVRQKWPHDEKYLGSGVLLKKAIAKYGEENFKREAIDEFKTKNEENEKEKFWISHYRKTKNVLYNIADGGQGGGFIKSEAIRKKISASLMGRKRPAEFCELMCKIRTGSSLTQEHKNNIGKALKGVPKSAEHIESLRRAARRKQDDH